MLSVFAGYRAPVCALLFALSSCAVTAQDTATKPPNRFANAPFKSTVEELRAASAGVPVDPSAEAQLLLEEGSYRFAPDGTSVYQHRMIYRLDSTAGVKDWAEISSEWDPWNEKPVQLQARVLQANGKFVELDQKTITDSPVKAEDAETYSSSHVRRAPLPGLAVGVIVEELETLEEKTPYFVAGNIHTFVFRSSTPVAVVRLTVDLPASMPFKDRIDHLPALHIERTEADGRRHVVYEQIGMPASHESDIDLPTNDRERPLVTFASGESWKGVATGYASLADPQTVPEDTLSILPSDNGQASRHDLLAAVVASLHKEVRYTGVEFGEARLTPQRPSEVIRRHYGDCKDKATLLVAMLRAEKIPAHLALLSTGPGRDVDPALPGMNQFDHAIVYVPATEKEPAVWIDATAEFYEVGSLPWDDEGRLALIISPETTELTRTPLPKMADSSLIETRTFTLSSYGPAHVVESSETHGTIDANYRSEYGGEDNVKLRTSLEKYVQEAYSAKTLTSVTHGLAQDVSKPFALTLVVDGAKRGTTAMDEALVAIFPSMVLDSLPSWFKQAAPVIGPDTSAEARREMERAQAARVSTYIYRPFTDERRIRVAVPAGFTLRALPAEKTTTLGAATVTEKYEVKDGYINAVLRMDSGPGKLSAEDALAMRKAVLEFQRREYVGIFFDQTGSKLLAQGKIREALVELRGQSMAHPNEALPHLRLSRALLQAGIGDAAKLEARRATELDPKSAVAFSNLGWTLQHDDLGVRFGKGFDRGGSITAYQKSIKLDADDNDPRFDLAVLYEFDQRGVRYAADASMAEAVATYRELMERTRESDPAAMARYRENLLYALLFSRKFVEVDKMLAEIPASDAHAAMAIASATAQRGANAGVAQADKANLGSSERSKSLLTAGSLLAQLRLYPEASSILQAGVSGGSDAPTTARQIELYKNLHPVTKTSLPATNPAAPVEEMTIGMISGTLTRDQAAEVLAHHAYASDAAFQRAIHKNLQSSGFMRAVAEKGGLSEIVLTDLVEGSMIFNATGDDAIGYPVSMKSVGGETTHFFVTKEDGRYRIVADSHDSVEVGNEVLYLLKDNRAPAAKALLDWARDLTHKSGQDDSLAGPLLPRFWTVGSSKPGADSPEAMRVAAIALLAGSMDAKPYLAEISTARTAATGQRQTDLDLLLAVAANGAEEPKLASPAALRLLDAEPDSLTALRLAGQAYALQGDGKGWLAMLAPRLAKKPKDHDLLVEQARAYQATSDFAASRVALQSVLDSEKATASDYNGFAWLGLLDNHLGEPEIKAAQQSNMMSKNASFADLHTLACIYAAEGKLTEARQVLSQAMMVGNQPEPNSAVWYALGLIYEQYGAPEAALAAYRKVEAHEGDDHTYLDPGSSYVLAQKRVTALTSGAR